VQDKQVTALSLSYPFDQDLEPGPHTFYITASSSGALGTAGVRTEIATVEVLGGPLRVIGPVIAFPAPFSFSKHGKCDIQYVLSQDGDVDVYLISVSGQTVKKFTCFAGQEGGTAGYNKLAWDGMTLMSARAGNAVYVGTIVGRAEGKLLAKFKISVVD